MELELSKTKRAIVIEDLGVRDMIRSARGTKEKPGKNVKAKSGLTVFKNMLGVCLRSAAPSAVSTELEVSFLWR